MTDGGQQSRIVVQAQIPPKPEQGRFSHGFITTLPVSPRVDHKPARHTRHVVIRRPTSITQGEHATGPHDPGTQRRNVAEARIGCGRRRLLAGGGKQDGVDDVDDTVARLDVRLRLV